MSKIIVPTNGKKITMSDGQLVVPHNPIIPFIEGEGIGADIWKSSVNVFNSAVRNAYDGQK